MSVLVKIERQVIGEGEVNAVDARELHAFLGSKQEFAHWIKDRINKYGFMQGVDFTLFDKVIKNPSGGRPTTEYFLTIDTAKEMAMVEKTAKGQEARRYFIACEKKLKEVASTPATYAIPKTLHEALRLAADLEEENVRKAAVIAAQESKLRIAKPFVKHAIADHLRNKSLADAAAELKLYVEGINQLTLPKFLRDNGILYHHKFRSGAAQNRVNEDFRDTGWFIEEEALCYDAVGNPVVRESGGKRHHIRSYRLLVTASGRFEIKKLLLDAGYKAVEVPEIAKKVAA